MWKYENLRIDITNRRTDTKNNYQDRQTDREAIKETNEHTRAMMKQWSIGVIKDNIKFEIEITVSTNIW